MEYNRYQKAILDKVENGEGSICIEALAGTGKTSTIVEAGNCISPSLKTSFIAFNVSIATELESRLPTNIKAGTQHAAGAKAIYRKFPGIKMDSEKCRIIYRTFHLKPELEAPVLRLVSLAKTTASSSPDYESLIEHFELIVEQNQYDDLITFAHKVFSESRRNQTSFDFDDMIFWPAIGVVQMYRDDVMFVDESQDLNPSQILMIRNSLTPGGRLIAVGDRNQAIYGFRGADIAAMEKMVKTFAMERLPLSICYRCPTSVIELAQKIVPAIEASPKAITGEVRFLNASKIIETAEVDDLILCRTNAPLVETALRIIATGKKAQVRGRDIGKGLSALTVRVRRKYMVSTTKDFIRAVRTYGDEEIPKLLSANKNAAAAALSDQIDTLVVLAVASSTIDELLNTISTMFSDDARGVILSSIHKAKGSEADNVTILHPELLPHPMAKSDWQLQQEMNLKYVAITRAKKTLTFAV